MKAVFLDRDGVINAYPGDRNYVTTWDEFKFLPGVKSSLVKLTKAGFKLFIISNQAGVGKGLFPQENLDLITMNMLKGLSPEVLIEGVYYCTHRLDENCACRKPKTGLIEMALAKLEKKGTKIELENSFFIGDTINDCITGRNAGLKTILVFSGKERIENKSTWQCMPDFSALNLSKAVDIILKNN